MGDRESMKLGDPGFEGKFLLIMQFEGGQFGIYNDTQNWSVNPGWYEGFRLRFAIIGLMFYQLRSLAFLVESIIEEMSNVKRKIHMICLTTISLEP